MQCSRACLAVGIMLSTGVGPTMAMSPASSPSPPSEPAAQQAEAPAELDGPWIGTLRVGFTAAFAQSHGVVGQQDAVGVTMGGAANGRVSVEEGAHGWETSADYGAACTYTSVLGQFVKTAERCCLDSRYEWLELTWLGP